jgi:hypothetical protein
MPDEVKFIGITEELNFLFSQVGQFQGLGTEGQVCRAISFSIDSTSDYNEAKGHPWQCISLLIYPVFAARKDQLHAQ